MQESIKVVQNLSNFRVPQFVNSNRFVIENKFRESEELPLGTRLHSKYTSKIIHDLNPLYYNDAQFLT